MEKEVVFGHSPDSDDAFMYYGIASGDVKLDNYQISHLMVDIESLNIHLFLSLIFMTSKAT